MVTAALHIGTDAGALLVFLGLLVIVVGVFVIGAAAWDRSEGAVWAGIIIGFVGLVMLFLGAFGAGQGTKELPDFSKRCRGKIELSVFKTDRRFDDVKRVGEAIEDSLGCEDAVETVVQVPFGSPYLDEARLEPPRVELVPEGTTAPKAPGGVNLKRGHAPNPHRE